MSTQKGKQQSLTVSYARWVIKNRWLVIFLSIISALAFGSGGRFVGFSNDYRDFFGKDNPQLIAFEEVESTYTKSDNLMFVVSPKDGIVFSPKTLTGIQELTKRAWQIPYSTRVDSLSNYQHTRAVGDDLFVDNLVTGNAKDLTEEQIAEIKKIALSEPMLKNLIIREDANVTGVVASIQLPKKKPHEVLEVTQFANQLKADFEKDYPDLKVRISGLIPMNGAFAEMAQNDAMTLTPIMYLMMLIVMIFLLKSIGGTLAALGVILLSVIAAMGAAGYMGILLTPPSATAPTVILTLAIADSVHILISMLVLMRKGWKKSEALVESLRINFQPVFLTSATTLVGFLCLNFSDAPPFHDLGNITAVGVTFAFLYSITFLPALVSVLPLKVRVLEGTGKKNIFDRLGDGVIHHSRKILWGSVAVIVALVACIPSIDLNDEFVKWFDQRVEFRRDTDYMTKNLTGIYSFQYSLDSGNSEGVSEPQFMKKVDDFANWWREQPETIHVATYTDIMKKLNKTMHADNQSWYKLPDNLDLAAQYLLLYEMSLPFGLDLNNQIDIDKSKAKIVITVNEITSRQGREASSRGDIWLEKNAPPSMHAKGTGPSVMFSYISDRNVKSMIKGTTIAFILITLLMMISLKSFKYGLISFLPNVFPALMAFGVWALTVNQVGMAIAVVASATLGIIVDDSVHFLSKFLRAKRENNATTEDAIRYSLSSVGLALVTTSVILVIGFGILTYSSFLLNWTLGMLSVLTIIFALMVDFLFLPSFLVLVDGKENKNKNK